MSLRDRYAGSAAEEFLTRLKRLNFVDTIMLLGAASLLSMLPLLVLVSSFANRRIEDDLSQHLGLNAGAAHIVSGLFSSSHSRSVTATVLAMLLAVGGTLAVAGAMQSVYEQVFGRTHHRHDNVVRLLLWVAGLCGWLMLDSVIAAATPSLPAGLLLDVAAVFASTTVFFCWSMHLLLCGQLPWRRLLVPALVTAVLWLGLEGFAALYFSSTITSDSRLYGQVGVVFSLLTWFIAIAAVMVLGALAGDVWQRRRHRADAAVVTAAPPPDGVVEAAAPARWSAERRHRAAP